MATISALVNTLNEERDLPFTLRSLAPWVDEIVVVDMYSDDRTVEIAESFGARVFAHERTGTAEGSPRRLGVSKCSGEWILIVDADEIVPSPLAERLRAEAERENLDAVVVPRRNYLLGRAMEGTGWGARDDRHPRFFRPPALRLNASLHGGYSETVPGARLQQIPPEPGLCLVHFAYYDVTDFVGRLNRYTTIEAEHARESGERPPGRLRALNRARREFQLRFLRARGYRDGWVGFYAAALMAVYRFVLAAKLEEMERTGGGEAVRASYRETAEELLAAYGEPADRTAAGPD